MEIFHIWEIVYILDTKRIFVRLTQNLTKLYYSIGEVAEMFDVSPSLIRYWESEFKNLKPQKNRKGDRKFTVRDIKEMEKIYTLVKERGFTLIGAQRELKGNKSFEYKSKAVIKLEKLRIKLDKLRNKLNQD